MQFWCFFYLNIALVSFWFLLSHHNSRFFSSANSRSSGVQKPTNDNVSGTVDQQAYQQSCFSYTSIDKAVHKPPRNPQTCRLKATNLKRVYPTIASLSCPAKINKKLPLQIGRSNTWQTQVYGRYICWHSSVIQDINF